MRRASVRAFIFALKYAPVIMALVMMLYCVLCLWEIRLIGLVMILAKYSIPTVALFWLASESFGFCPLHRAFVIYDATACLCIDYERLIGFGDALFWAHLIYVAVGLVLFASLARILISKAKGVYDDTGKGSFEACRCTKGDGGCRGARKL